jgi:hypothetical protein
MAIFQPIVVDANITGTVNRPISSGNGCVYIIEEPCEMLPPLNVTVTNNYAVMSNDIEIAITLPYIFVVGQKYKFTYSNNAPVTPVIKYNKLSTSKTLPQTTAQTSNPTPGIGFGYDGVYDATYARWWYLRNIGTATNTNYLEFVDSDFKLTKGLAANRTSSLGFTTIQEIGNYVYTFSGSVVYIINKTTLAVSQISYVGITGLYKFTTNNSITKIFATSIGSVLVLNPSDNSYTIISLPSGAQYRHAVFCAYINRVAIGAVAIARVAFIDIEGNVIDGSEITTTQTVNYLNVSANGLKLHCSLTTSASYDDIVIHATPANRIKTNISISQLTSTQQGFVYEYGGYIYFWLTANTIVVVDVATSTYVKTISGVNGAQFGLVESGNVWCTNSTGGGNGQVSKFALATETVTNYATNNTPIYLSKHPVTGQIWVGCNDATNGLSII